MVLYRYEIQYKSDYDDTGVYLTKHRIVKETEASYCIQPYGRKKWIRKTSHNAFAHTTKKGAKAHFVRRTSKRIQWFKYWKEECDKALKIIEGGDEIN